jgi:hypothetical protein
VCCGGEVCGGKNTFTIMGSMGREGHLLSYLRVGDPAIVQDLQQEVEYVHMRLGSKVGRGAEREEKGASV